MKTIDQFGFELNDLALRVPWQYDPFTNFNCRCTRLPMRPMPRKLNKKRGKQKAQRLARRISRLSQK